MKESRQFAGEKAIIIVESVPILAYYWKEPPPAPKVSSKKVVFARCVMIRSRVLIKEGVCALKKDRGRRPPLFVLASL